MTDRIAPCFDQFLYVKDWSVDRIAAQARQLQLDIAIDLKGYTQHDARSCLQRAARRCRSVTWGWLAGRHLYGLHHCRYGDPARARGALLRKSGAHAAQLQVQRQPAPHRRTRI